MVSITHRKRHCKNLIGGVKSAYLSPYQKLLRSEIEYDGVSLTEFPETLFYKFEMAGGTVFEQQQTDSEGGKYFNVNLTLTFNKITIFDNNNFQKLLKKDYFMVIEDYNGNFFLLGFKNGITGERIETSTTQYTIDFTAMEEEFAPYVNDIMGTDIIVFDYTDYIFQNDDNYYFQDDSNYIF
jgi:hypothetical protein